MFEWPSVNSIKELGEYAVSQSGQQFPGWFPHADSHIQNALDNTQALHGGGENDLITLASNMLWHLQGTTLSQSEDPMSEVVQQAAIDGNKRSAVANVLTFLQQNGVDISGIPFEELSTVVVQASKEDQISGPAVIAEFLRGYLDVKTSGWIRADQIGSRYGFVMIAADIAQLATDARAKLLQREDIAVLGRPNIWPTDHPNYNQQNVQDYGPMSDKNLIPETDSLYNQKYNANLYSIIEFFLMRMPDELYKFFPWLVTQIKKGVIGYDPNSGVGYNRANMDMPHIKDILTQFRNHTEYLRTTPRNAPNWAPTPDINQMDFPQVEAWVYERNALGVALGPNTEWEEPSPAYDFGNGYGVWSVKTETDLKQEGQLMGHCVGGYCGMVAGGDTTIWSLRDDKLNPHATIEMQPNDSTGGYNVIQVQGKQNGEPKDEYKDMIKDWFSSLNTQGVSLTVGGEISDTGELADWYGSQQPYGFDTYGLSYYELEEDYRGDWKFLAAEIADDMQRSPAERKDTLLAFSYLADRSEAIQEAKYWIEKAAEAVIEDAAEQLLSEWEDKKSQMEQVYEDWKSAEFDRWYEEHGGDEDFDEDDYEEPTMELEEWVAHYGYEFGVSQEDVQNFRGEPNGAADFYDDAVALLGWDNYWWNI